ncbi:MAG TPA: NUDIX domain-containing protein [Streptosporangiaceae bacterium]|jgi:ADP-ribose pyrophosphatase YjhB (NUDIX family)
MELPDPAPEPDSLPLRRAARVLLLDPLDRVLLMRYDDQPPDGRHWSTPGGGLNPGEEYPQAALRELAEETGWDDIALQDQVLAQTRVLTHGDRRTRQFERLYLARTGTPGREIRGVEAMHAADGIAAWRWWSLAELESTAEVIYPAGIARLMREVLGTAAP